MMCAKQQPTWFQRVCQVVSLIQGATLCKEKLDALIALTTALQGNDVVEVSRALAEIKNINLCLSQPVLLKLLDRVIDMLLEDIATSPPSPASKNVSLQLYMNIIALEAPSVQPCDLQGDLATVASYVCVRELSSSAGLNLLSSFIRCVDKIMLHMMSAHKTAKKHNCCC